jgi:putative oxidoreductase
MRPLYHQTTNTGRSEEEAMTVSIQDAGTGGSRPVPGANRAKAKAKDSALWVVRAALALGLISAGSQKLAGSHQMVHMFSQIGAGQWLRYLVGSLETSGAIGLLIGKLTASAAAGVTALMLGATITNIFVIQMSPALPLVFLAAAAAVFWDRRHELKALLRLA